jgi:hypothetical protein
MGAFEPQQGAACTIDVPATAFTLQASRRSHPQSLLGKPSVSHRKGLILRMFLADRSGKLMTSRQCAHP